MTFSRLLWALKTVKYVRHSEQWGAFQSVSYYYVSWYSTVDDSFYLDFCLPVYRAPASGTSMRLCAATWGRGSACTCGWASNSWSPRSEPGLAEFLPSQGHVILP